jgi:hypothetical protein
VSCDGLPGGAALRPRCGPFVHVGDPITRGPRMHPVVRCPLLIQPRTFRSGPRAGHSLRSAGALGAAARGDGGIRHAARSSAAGDGRRTVVHRRTVATSWFSGHSHARLPAPASRHCGRARRRATAGGPGTYRASSVGGRR